MPCNCTGTAVHEASWCLLMTVSVFTVISPCDMMLRVVKSRSYATGSHIFGRLQKLSTLQKLQTISKSGLSAYNDHVQNTAENANTFDR